MKIKISGITDEILIGCYEYEKQNIQKIILDIECELYPFDYSDDDLKDTVNYDELADFAKSTLSKEQYNLLEGLSQFIAKEILNKFHQIKIVKIDLLKPALSGVKACEIKVSYTEVRKIPVALALGSNHIYLPQQQIITAIELLGEYIDKISIGNFYKSAPVGYLEQNDFINTAIIGVTTLEPRELFAKIKAIEKIIGKEEKIINGPRIIDIDLLLFGDLIYKCNYLQIPHKEMHNRDFVLVPLADVAPNLVHPIFNKTILSLCDEVMSNQNNILEQIGYYKDEI
ncbi:MAG: 2-amino-4-hydroxy-6-hydroxymethyldihydropteridine diphosphokinase [Neisseriaceae bacterium]